jgi:hypothetical protein
MDQMLFQNQQSHIFFFFLRVLSQPFAGFLQVFVQ